MSTANDDTPGESSVNLRLTLDDDDEDEDDDDYHPTVEARAPQPGDAAVLKLMRRRYRQANTAEDQFRKDALEDQKFRMGTRGDHSYQWPTGVQEDLKRRNQPVLTINRAPSFIHQVTNQARAANLRIHVTPINDKGDPKTAEILQGYIRNIEMTSFADRAYAMASDKQAEQGRGAFSFITEWVDDEGEGSKFRQRIRILRERNPLAIYWDPTARDAAYQDAQWSMKATDIEDSEFEDRWGFKATEEDISTLETEGDKTGDWFPSGKTRVMEYFSREPDGKSERWCQLTSGKELPYPKPDQIVALKALGEEIERSRWIQKKKTVWRHCTATRILDETTWGAKTGRFVPVLGDELEVDGEIDCRGVIRDSKDAARIYNVEVTALINAVGQMQRAPVQGAVGAFGKPGSAQYKAWQTANVDPPAFLEFTPMSVDGQPVQEPHKPDLGVNLEGMVVAIHQADTDYKSTAGFNDASMGVRGPQESAKAITARQRQDELGSGHYLDNLRFSLAAGARMLIDLLRSTATTPHVVRVKDNSERERKVMVYSGKENDPRQEKYLARDAHDQPIPFQPPEGISNEDIFDVGVGEFHVECSAGPDAGSRREESVEAITTLFKGMPPEIAVKFYDLLFKVMDFPLAQQFADRAKSLMPPEMQDDGDGAPGGANIPPQLRMQMSKMKQDLQKASEVMHGMKQALDTDQVKADNAMKLKEKDIEFKKLELQVQAGEKDKDREAKMASAALLSKDHDVALLREESAQAGTRHFEAIQSALDRMHELLTQQRDHAHESRTLAASHAAALQSGELDRQGEASAQASDQAATAQQADEARQAAAESQASAQAASAEQAQSGDGE